MGTSRGLGSTTLGRWPANLILDEDAARALDEQSGERSSGFMRAGQPRAGNGYEGGWGSRVTNDTHGDTGGASRFFYVAKASSGERHYAGRCGHPTVKPVSLMRWLVRLVTPPRGLVLDPFAGSGSTGIAALSEGMSFVGLELDAESCAMARRRIAGPLFADDGNEPETNSATRPEAFEPST
jgi:site-specific DNA-methyltransferase (adenine-specific)